MSSNISSAPAYGVYASQPIDAHSRRNLHPQVMVDQAGRPLPPKKNLAF